MPIVDHTEELKHELKKRATETWNFLQNLSRTCRSLEKTEEIQDAVLYFKGKQANVRWEQRRNYIKKRLTLSGLRIKEVRTEYGKKPRVYFLISCPTEVLLKIASGSKMIKKTKQSLMKEFSLEQAEDFEGIENPSSFFDELEKYQLTKIAIDSCKVQPDDEITPQIFGTFKHHFFRPGISIVPLCLSIQIATNLFPLHNFSKKGQLAEEWLHTDYLKSNIWKNPSTTNNSEKHPQNQSQEKINEKKGIDQEGLIRAGKIVWIGVQNLFSDSAHPFRLICGYFGEQIGFYFAWFNYYNKFLLFPAIVGLLLTLQNWINFHVFDKGDTVLLYTVCVIIWGTLFTQLWRRHSIDLALQWGVLDLKKKEQARPGFRGDLQKSEITGEYELVYSHWKSLSKFLFSCLIFSIIIVAIYLYMIWFFRKKTQYLRDGTYWTSHLATFLYSSSLTLVSYFFQKLAVLMNHWENIRTESEFADRLAIRIFVFECLNCYGSVIYLLFYLRDINALYDHIFFFLVIRQLMSIFKKSIFTYSIEQWKLYRQRKRFLQQKEIQQNQQQQRNEDEDEEEDDDDEDENEENSGLQVYEIEAKLETYASTIEEHLHLIIQFGYLIIFASISPLAPTWALICNLIEIKSQAFQLCYTYQRPWPIRVSGIGILQTLTEVIVLLSVIINVVFLGFFTQHYEELWRKSMKILSSISILSDDITFEPETAVFGLEEKFLTMFTVEHLVLMVVILVAQLVRSQTPSSWVLGEIKRQNYLQEKVIDALTSVKLNEIASGTEELADRVEELQAMISSAQSVRERPSKNSINISIQEKEKEKEKEIEVNDQLKIKKEL